MFIRQRRTMLDPFLLKVVCPFLRAHGYYGLLAMLFNFWNPVVDNPTSGIRSQSFGRTLARAVIRALAALSLLLWPMSFGKRSS